MIRKKRESGKDSFELIPEKANSLHDDRAYVSAMACWGLMLERRKMIIPTRKKVVDIKSAIHIRKPVINTRYS